MPTRRRFLEAAAFTALTASSPRLLGAASPSEAAGQPIVVSTPNGRLRGQVLDGIRTFRGVPFARPPVGPLRFRPTQPLQPWTGVRDALVNAPSAMQTAGWVRPPFSEDCLYLNLWAPAGPGPYPVLVWIHGGGFTGGTASDSSTSGAQFADAGIVCVEVQYRLGAFGFLDVEPLLGASYAGSANNALRDLMQALAWVRDNIASFGGDPSRVSIGGESAGAKLTDTLLGVPTAQPLFHQAISESGGADRVAPSAQAQQVAEGFGEAWTAQQGQPAAALATAPAQKIIDVQHQFIAHWPKHFPFRPEIDGALLPRMPAPAIALGLDRGKRLLIGTNRDESAFFLGPHPEHDPVPANLGNLTEQQFTPIYDEYARLYPDMSPEQRRIRAVTAEEYWVPSIRVADAAASGGCATWMYRLDFTQNAGRLRGYAFHSLDLALVWDDPHPNAGNVPQETALATQVHQAWVAFLQGETPAAPGLPAWPQYTADERTTMILNTTSHVEDHPQQAELSLWKGLL